MRIEIVDDVKKRMKETDEYVKAVMNGAPIDPKKAEYTIIMTPDDFTHIFSPQRIRLLLRIRDNNFRSIYELAKNLGRKYEAVHRDVKFLEGYGFIKLKKKDNGRVPVTVPVKMPRIG